MSYYHRALDQLERIEQAAKHIKGGAHGILLNHAAIRIEQAVHHIREILAEWRYEHYSDDSSHHWSRRHGPPDDKK